MNQFFSTQYTQKDLQQRLAQRRSQNVQSRSSSISMAPGSEQPNNENSMDMTGGMVGGDTLDDIITQNNIEIQRRQSLPQYSSTEVDRRSSMMDFGSNTGTLDEFQFVPTTMAGGASLRRQSAGDLVMGGFGNMSSGMDISSQHMGYSASIQDPSSLTIDTTVPFGSMSTDMVHGMMGYPAMTMQEITEESAHAMDMFSPTNFGQPYGAASMDPMPNDFMMASERLPSLVESMPGGEQSDDIMASIPLSVPDSNMGNSPQSMSMGQTMGSTLGSNIGAAMGAYNSPVTTAIPTASLPSQASSFSLPQTPAPVPAMSEPEVTLPKVEPKAPSYGHIYSSSGFDMLGALMKVAMRKNPEIDIGKVDMSCAFVVCDVTMFDCPIVYVSEIFERLTGYSKHEVTGQNCRFLQSPEGKVQAGARREFVDNDSVYYLRQRIESKKEAQRSLINYRKGGQPFMNLLTMIPITGEDDKEIKYFVGFQVDLVEKPTSVEGKSASGLYTVDYSQSNIPKYVWQPPESQAGMDGGQTISRDDVSTVLNSINSNSKSEWTKQMWDKVLLENTDDVVHVLSLKGLFLYLSPSCRQVLEYDSSELVGSALSSVCHPSDIVPVTRELKDTSSGTPVNVVFRIRRKRSGYTWFESHGSLCVEQGKGRKFIILVGRERPVYALARNDIEAAGNINESEIWTKLSTSGMFLFVSSNVRTHLDRSPEELVGTSIQALMRSESKVEFSRSLERARTGKRVTHKHEMLNRRGLVLQAQTTLYPGDASEGQKPTFLVAQTRLLKNSSRTMTPHNLSGSGSKAPSSMGRLDPSDSPTTPTRPSNIFSGLTAVDSPSSNSSVLGPITQAGGNGLTIGTQDAALASEDNIFDELKTTRCTSWQFELRQMEKNNRLLAEELAILLANKKKRKRRKGAGNPQRDCANCHTRVTPEWRRGPSGQRDLCNSCGLRWAKQVSRGNSEQSGTIRPGTTGLYQSDSSTSRS